MTHIMSWFHLLGVSVDAKTMVSSSFYAGYGTMIAYVLCMCVIIAYNSHKKKEFSHRVEVSLYASMAFVPMCGLLLIAVGYIGRFAIMLPGSHF